MSFCYFVLFCLILTHVSPNTSFNNYQINFQYETWNSNYSDKQSVSYLNKSGELQIVLQSAFSSLNEKYIISIDSLKQGAPNKPNEFSIKASVNFTGNSTLESSKVKECLKLINASLLENSSFTMPISTDLTTISLSTASSNPINVNTTVSTVSGIPSHITINQTYIPTTESTTYPNYTLSTSTSSSELNSLNSTVNNTASDTTLLSTIFSNETISSTSTYNTDYLSTFSNLSSTMSDVSTTNVNGTLSFENLSTLSTNTANSSNFSTNFNSSETTQALFTDSNTDSNTTKSYPFNSTESSIMLQSSSSTTPIPNANTSEESSSTLQKGSSTPPISNSFQSADSTTTSQSTSSSSSTTRPSVGPYTNWTISFKDKLWDVAYSNMKHSKTVLFVQKLIEEIAKAINVDIKAVIIYSLKSGSIIAESGIQSNSLNQGTLNSLLRNIGAEIISPTTSAPTTDSGLPTYAVALIAVFTTCIVIAIIFVATALICRHRRLKGYGRHEVEFFEMDDGWKKHSTRNPSFQMD